MLRTMVIVSRICGPRSMKSPAKHRLAICVSKDTIRLRISQSLQQPDEFVGVSVNVPDDVVDNQFLILPVQKKLRPGKFTTA